MDGGGVMQKGLDRRAVGAVTVVPTLLGPRTPECGSHPGRRWHCVQAERGRETEVRDRLEDQGFGAFLPQIIALRPVRPGVQVAAAVPAFPGYLFARFDPRADQWRPILYTRGVKGLISSAPERPVAIPDAQIGVLLAAGYDRPIAADPVPELIDVGARVRVVEGPFAGTDGVCLWDDAKRVRLLMDLLNGAAVTVQRKVVQAVK